MENEFRSVLEVLPGLVWTALPNGNLDFLNEGWCQYTGLILDDARGLGWYKAVHPSDLRGLLECWRSAVAVGHPAEMEVRLRRFDGEYRRFVFRLRPLTDESGRVVKWCGISSDVEDLKRSQEALLAREDHYRPIADSIPALIAFMTPAGEVESVNRHVLEYFGATLEELKGWSASDSVHPDDLPAVIAAWMHSVATGEIYDIEHRMRRADGIYRWFHVRGLPLRDAEGRIVRWYVLETDIDDRKSAEAALRATERDLNSIVNTFPAMAWCALGDGSCDLVNQRWLEYAGFSLDQARGWGWKDVVHPDDLDGLVEHWRACVASGAPGNTEARMRRFDGVYRWFLFLGNPMRDESGKIVRWFGTNVDIEDRKQAEEALRSSERSLIQIINTIPTAAWSTRPDGYCDFLSDRWLEYAGFSAEEGEGWGWAAAIHPDDAEGLREHWQAALASGDQVDAEARIRRFDGAYRWFLFRANPLRDDSGNIVKWYGTNVDIEDRKRSDQALLAREHDLGLIINTIPMLAWSALPDGHCEFFNERWLDYTGMSAEQARGWGWADAIHSEDLKGLVDYWRSHLASGGEVEVEARIRRFDGEYRWFLFRASALRDESGSIVKWYGTNTDIEDRKRADQAVRESERNLNLIINTIPMLAWSARPDGFCDFLNQRWLDYAGFSAEEAEGWGWTAAIHPDDVKDLADRWEAALASGQGQAAEARMRRFDGEYRWFLFLNSPLRDESGKVIKWYGTTIDVEDRKRAEEAFRANERSLKLIVNTIPMLAWSARPDGYCDFLNQRWLDYAGFKAEEAEGWGWVSAVHPDDVKHLADRWEAALADGNGDAVEARLRRHDGEYRWFVFLSSPLRDESGKVLKWYGTNVDIQDRKRADAERRLAEQARDKVRSELTHMTRVASLGALTASIAHEVNQPLSGIITNANTCLRMLAADPPKIDGALETVRRTIRDGNRASDVIARLRSLFSNRDTVADFVDLNEAAQEVIALSSSELQRNRVTLRSELAADLPLVIGDRIQLQQVILNLLNNASDAMSKVDVGPRHLTIRTEIVENDSVRLTVQDTGVGVDPQNLDKLFEPFYTTKNGGMGMGLSVSRTIIESHSGRLWAEPNDGAGASFSFSVPHSREGATNAGNLNSSQALPLDNQYTVRNP